MLFSLFAVNSLHVSDDYFYDWSPCLINFTLGMNLKLIGDVYCTSVSRPEKVSNEKHDLSFALHNSSTGVTG